MNSLMRPAPRPGLGFRVGVTGARPNRLDAAAVPALSAAVAALLGAVRTAIDTLAEEPAIARHYAAGGAIFRCISPLAEGSDRIVAEAALAAGFRLEVPMPFREAEYRKTFDPEPKPGFPPFDPLLAKAVAESGEAAVLALDGDAENDAEQAYRAVGRLVVRNSDLLIAIWDGKGGKAGGTAEIVRYAAHAHVPIWWIDSDLSGPPRLIIGPAMFDRRWSAPAGGAGEAELAVLLRQSILPPDPGEPARHGWLGELMHRGALLLGDRREPLPAFFAEAEEPRRRWPWTAYAWLIERITPALVEVDVPPLPRVGSPQMGAADDAVERVWEEMFAASDRHGNKYADRYRSAYVLVIGLAALTVALLGLGLALPHPAGAGWRLLRVVNVALTALEFIALIAITAIVGAGELGRWHEKWIAYRLLAELCRKERVLVRLAWSLPLARVSALPGEAERNAAPRNGWVAWYVMATMRTAPLPLGSISRHLPRARALGAAMIAEQEAYHRRRRERSAAAVLRLARVADVAFGVTILLVVAKLVLAAVGDGHAVSVRWLGMASVALVALSAASVSLRSYAEFGLLRLQSERMLGALQETKAELAALDPDRPMAAASLGAVLLGLALAMLEDVAGWSLLFRTKTPETG